MSKTYVWDLPVRLFHWSLVALVSGLWWTAENAHMEWHARLGYGVLFLLIFRVLWGFAGSTQARFASFLRAPSAVVAYLRGQQSHGIGHNPAGGWMVMLLLLLLASQAISGLFSNDDIMLEGPWVKWIDKTLSDTITYWHKAQFKAIVAAVALHVSAVGFYLLIKRENLVRPMIPGYKNITTTLPNLTAPAWRAGLIAVVAAALVWLAINV